MAKAQEGRDLNPGSLLNDEQVRLFDAMHRLSSLKVSGEIETPQLVVVGAQSSGKSSVLEALVRFHFPVDNTKPTTRFPIKLVLRKAEAEVTRVRIEPGSARSEEEKRALVRLAEALPVDSFDNIMKRAKADLKVSPSGTLDKPSGTLTTFCDDVLVIERHGPSLPKLSLIDLPGLFNAASAGQTLDDKAMINGMASKYIKSPRSIVLLVVSAEVNDYNNVPVVGMVQGMLQEHPSLKRRVVCVITRPDTAGSLEATRSVLAKNSPFAGYFMHPWHVIRNQDQDAREKHQPLDERDRIEDQFFGGSDWDTVPKTQKGIAALRETLKSMILSHTQHQLPQIISEIKARIKEAEARLDITIRARATPEARRAYLGDIADKFSLLTREAVKGTYENQACNRDHETGEQCAECEGFFARFGDNSLESQQKRLRANVRALNQSFASSMRRYGKTVLESEGDRATTPADQSPDPPPQYDDGKPRYQPHETAQYYVHELPERLGRREYETWVSENMYRWKSKGPAGEPSDGAYLGLFEYQAEKWTSIANQHVKAVWRVVKDFIDLTLAASCPDRDVRAELRRVHLDERVKCLELQADRTLRDLIACHGQPNSGFYDSFVEARAVKEQAKALLHRLAAMKFEPANITDDNGSTTGTEQPNGQQETAQQSNTQRPGRVKLESRKVESPLRNGEQKAKDGGQKSREAFLTNTLQELLPIISAGYPFLDNFLVREMVIPMIVQKVSVAFGGNNDINAKEELKRAETDINKAVQALYPSHFEDLAAARVIEQVEMHYEGIRSSFIGYVISLVIEHKIMGKLSQEVLTMKLVRDMDETQIESIAGERPEDKKIREKIESDLKTMREVLRVIEETHYDSSNPMMR
ncbi:hypothetical protein S7711_07393 [Stachybotrys chartarum IBT 7711]|uniref:GED domain-containing protein n=1 Tax=Stachybotrys chartarum (strain CBS 109288 / IBT 7711) TaxID=1280523 RepID=A0A084AFF1_STACB|nr:hypothetical protein S7711_07393 [Stachybotrys chartarum IBT 7711]